MKRKKMVSHVLYLPEEIIRNILKRLPVKFLIQFQCVCKDWKNLLENPSFIADHLQHSSHQNPSLLFEYISPSLRLRPCFLDCRFQVGDVQRAPLSITLQGAWIVGSCNGLICLELHEYNEYPPSILLWNPATTAVRHVPKTQPNILLSKGCAIGFGFSEVVDDYKIVKTCAKVNRVEVFSLRRGTWEGKDIGNLRHVRLQSETVTVNGAIFWFGFKRDSEEEGEDNIEVGEDEDYMEYEEGETGVKEIVSFDIAEEVFTVIPMPDLDYNAKERLAVYENKLAILREVWDDDDDETPHWIDLWVLDEGSDASGKTWSWTKRYSSSPLSCTITSMAIWGNEIVYKLDSEEDNEEARNVLCLMNLATNEVKSFSNPYCG